MFRFKMAVKKEMLISQQYSRDQNLKKKTLSPRNFSIKFGSKLKNINTFSLECQSKPFSIGSMFLEVAYRF